MDKVCVGGVVGVWNKFPFWHSGLRAIYCTYCLHSNDCAPQTGKCELDKELRVSCANTVFRNQTSLLLKLLFKVKNS